MTAKRARQVKRAKAFARQFPYTFKLHRIPPQTLTWGVVCDPTKWHDSFAIVMPDDQPPSHITITHVDARQNLPTDFRSGE